MKQSPIRKLRRDRSRLVQELTLAKAAGGDADKVAKIEAHIAALQQALSAPGPDGVPLSAALSVAEQEAVVLYLQALQQQALEAQQQFALLQAAQQFGADRQQQPAPGDGGGKPTAPVVQKNETLDETVPSSGTPQ